MLGINDPNTELSLKVMNFWRQETHLPSTTVERLIEILRAMYSKRTEKDYLSYSTNLLLQLTSLSPDYTRPLFDTALDAESNFRNYDINFSWQQENFAMTPMFASSQSAFSQRSSPSSSLGTGMLRETAQAVQFTPTQEQGGSFNWMNPTIQVSVRQG